MEGESRKDNGNAASAWIERADELAQWSMKRLVLRQDRWGGYRAEGTITRTGTLSLDKLEAHFRAQSRSHICGVHPVDAANGGRWAAVDVDLHGDGEEGERAEANERAVVRWFEILEARGHRPLLTTSNGRGGFHLRILLSDYVSGERLYCYARSLVADFASHGLSVMPEAFPKQKDVKKCFRGVGNWLRLPGKHHTRDHWSTVWDGERWLAGHDAIDFILGLNGDDPGIVPVIPAEPEPQKPARRAAKPRTRHHTSNIDKRIVAYMAKLPRLGEGEGRDNVAFAFACFLVRDMQLPDGDALLWLEEWDNGNRPPKGRDRLAEIVKNAHAYGRHSYGEALRNDPPSASATTTTADAPLADCYEEANDRNETPAEPAETKTAEAEPPPLPMRMLLFRHLHRAYQPLHRQNTLIFSNTLGTHIDFRRAAIGPGSSLLYELLRAEDVPRDRKGVDPSIPGILNCWRQHLAVAWADLLATLPDEPDAAEIGEGSEEEMRRHLSTMLGRIVSVGRQIRDGKDVTTVTEQRSLIDLCLMWATPKKWEKLRSYFCWCQLTNGPTITLGISQLSADKVELALDERRGRLRVAVRVNLAAQLNLRPMCEWSPTHFTRMCEHYGLGHGIRIGHDRDRAVELSSDFIANLASKPVDDAAETATREPGEEG